jgi:simple sugar transport system ATP-binding protein
VLILDEPTAALGVKQSFNVLKLIHHARAKGISVIFITHNVHHAYPIGDTFTLLNRGRSMGSFSKQHQQERGARHDGRRRRNAAS